MNNDEMLRSAKEQLALDLACSWDDFDKTENTITTYRRLEGRRLFSHDDYFVKVASFGKGAVISANEALVGYCRGFFGGQAGIGFFEFPKMQELDTELRKHGRKMNVVHELYLPDPSMAKEARRDGGFRLFERHEIPALYQYPGFPNALQYSEKCLRPDVLAAVSYSEGEISGVACASMDSRRLWQIGVDVPAAHRQQHIGTRLVQALTKEILDRGFVPYYGTWSANIASRLVARNCGYFPAWVEMYSVGI